MRLPLAARIVAPLVVLLVLSSRVASAAPVSLSYVGETGSGDLSFLAVPGGIAYFLIFPSAGNFTTLVSDSVEFPVIDGAIEIMSGPFVKRTTSQNGDTYDTFGRGGAIAMVFITEMPGGPFVSTFVGRVSGFTIRSGKCCGSIADMRITHGFWDEATAERFGLDTPRVTGLATLSLDFEDQAGAVFREGKVFGTIDTVAVPEPTSSPSWHSGADGSCVAGPDSYLLMNALMNRSTIHVSVRSRPNSNRKLWTDRETDFSSTDGWRCIPRHRPKLQSADARDRGAEQQQRGENQQWIERAPVPRPSSRPPAVSRQEPWRRTDAEQSSIQYAPRGVAGQRPKRHARCAL